MNDWSKRIDALDISLFKTIPSQTSNRDRRSLLAVQRAIARKHKEYVYLEIGSYLGGSIQPHLADDRCKRIYSIDPRYYQLPDDRAPHHVEYYKDNSTERMLNMLGSTGYGDVSKIECFDLAASEVELSKIIRNPQIAFIDGEHTKKAAISDFQFCIKIISEDGVILFHDFYIIYPALLEIFNQLDNQHHTYLPLKLEDNIFAIIFDQDILTSDPYLASLYGKHKYFLFAYRYFGFLFRGWRSLKDLLRGPLLTLFRNARSVLKKNTA